MNANLKRVYSNFALLCTAIISGLSFVAQKAGMEFVGPFTFNTIRTFLGALSLLPIIAFMKFKSLKIDQRSVEEKTRQRKILTLGGLICGALLFMALGINQYAMIFAPAGKAGFITSLYIIFVPLISVFLKRKLRINVKVSVIFAVIGLYFLCFKPGTPIEFSDIYLLISSLFFALHIIAVGYFSHRVSTLKLSCVQFLVVGCLSMPLMFGFEAPSLVAIFQGIKPILFSGVVVTGVAYTLQIFGQKNTPPVLASLILSSEAVFAVLGGVVMLQESFSVKEAVGCFFMAVAIVLSQLRFLKRRKKKELS